MFFVRSRLYTKEKATLNREGVLERERNREREEEKFFCFFTLLNLLLLWLLPRYFFFFFSQIKTKTCLRFLLLFFSTSRRRRAGRNVPARGEGVFQKKRQGFKGKKPRLVFSASSLFFLAQIKTHKKRNLRFLFVPAFQDVAAHVPLHLHLLLT